MADTDNNSHKRAGFVLQHQYTPSVVDHNKTSHLTRASAHQLKQAFLHPLCASRPKQQAICRNSNPSPALIHCRRSVPPFKIVHNECLNRPLAVEGAPPLQLLPSRCLFRASSRLALERPRVSPVTPCHVIIFHLSVFPPTRARGRGERRSAEPLPMHCESTREGVGGWERGLGSVLHNKPRQR